MHVWENITMVLYTVIKVFTLLFVYVILFYFFKLLSPPPPFPFAVKTGLNLLCSVGTVVLFLSERKAYFWVSP